MVQGADRQHTCLAKIQSTMAHPIRPNVLAEIHDLFDQGIPSAEIAQKYGIPLGSIIAPRAIHNRRNQDHIPEEAGIENAVTTTFGLELDLQRALRQNIGQLEDGLKVVDNGKERQVKSGRIDITGEDSQGRTVVIELKAGEADRDAVGQILGYMGDLGEETTTPVRGILVAGSFSISAVSAMRAVPNLELKRYQFNFSFEAVSGGF
jgi:Endonuclease NucS